MFMISWVVATLGFTPLYYLMYGYSPFLVFINVALMCPCCCIVLCANFLTPKASKEDLEKQAS